MDFGASEEFPKPTEPQIVRRDTGYESFCQEHPAFSSQGTELRPHSALQKRYGPEVYSLIETYSPTDSVSMLALIDKEEDAVRVAKTPDGRIIIAVADGVSNCALPRLASRASAERAVDFLKQKRPLRGMFGAVRSSLNGLKLIPVVDDIITAWREALTKADSRFSRTQCEKQVKRFEDFKAEEVISQTTLAVIEYDKQKSTAGLAATGDTRLILLKPGSAPEVIFDPNNNQIVYTGQASGMYSYAGDVIKEVVPLENGTVIIACTDGAFEFPNALERIRQSVEKARENNESLPPDKQVRLDFAAIDAVAQIIKASAGVPDDITMVAIEHKTSG